MSKYLSTTIKELSSGYRLHKFSPTDTVNNSLELAQHKLKDLNAFTCVSSELAVVKAEKSTKRYEAKEPLSSIDGLPIAIKDNFCVRQYPTTCGSKMLRNFIPSYDATVFEKLQKRGAILIGKTNLDEFAMGSGTIDSCFGPTKNVWSQSLQNDDWNIAGGSSGGSAVAVSSGICHAAIGSDTGGSTRNPASYCGVIGLKPTYGLVSRYGLIPLVNSMDVPGIFARTVDDCVEILNAIAGHDVRDSTTLRNPYDPISLAADISIKNIRIGIPKEYHCHGLSDEVLQTWRKIADILEDEGAAVRQISLPHTPLSIYVYTILNQCEVASNMARYDGIEYGHRSSEDYSTEQLYAKTREEGFNDVVKNRILAGNFFLLRKNYDKYFEQALRVRRLIADDFQQVFNATKSDQNVDLILTPTTLTDAPLYRDFRLSSNRDQCAVQDYCTQPANMAGIPALSIPIRMSSNYLPLSLQLMGPNLSEKLLLTVAKWIEAKVKFKSYSEEN